MGSLAKVHYGVKLNDMKCYTVSGVGVIVGEWEMARLAERRKAREGRGS